MNDDLISRSQRAAETKAEYEASHRMTIERIARDVDTVLLALYEEINGKTIELPNSLECTADENNYRFKYAMKRDGLRIAIQKVSYNRSEYGTCFSRSYKTIAKLRVKNEENKTTVEMKNSGWFSRFGTSYSFFSELQLEDVKKTVNLVRKTRDELVSHFIHTAVGYVRSKEYVDRTLEPLKIGESTEIVVSGAKPADEPPSLEGMTIDGYKLIKLIETGGFGQVYLVESPTENKKIMKIPYRELGLKSLERELIATKTLDHPNIIRLEHVRFEGEHPYVLMSYEPGMKSLDKIGSNLNLEQRLSVLRQVAQALAYAHEKQVVHCDIKPSNILVTKEGNAKLADFGLAKFDSKTLQESIVVSAAHVVSAGLVHGTWNYLSPEVAQGAQPTITSDIYSFALTCFEALVGRLPYPAEDVTATLKKATATEHMITALRKALSVEQSERYQAATEFANVFFQKETELEKKMVEPLAEKPVKPQEKPHNEIMLEE